jgi:hypothetical protein
MEHLRGHECQLYGGRGGGVAAVSDAVVRGQWRNCWRWIARNRAWSLTLGVIFVGCAAASFGYFVTYPWLRSAVRGLAQFALLLFTILAPIFFGAALIAPSRQWIAAVRVHAALYTAFMAVLTVSLGPRHYLADSSAVLTLTILYGILVFELFMVVIAVDRLPSAERQIDGGPWLFTGLTIVLFGGWAVGALAWWGSRYSLLMPAATSAISTPFSSEGFGSRILLYRPQSCHAPLRLTACAVPVTVLAASRR